uniref:Thymidylate synthase/dCMP hydroxymethylase domain-containing protein n=1 Tax=Chromera velia CCMP2878 TaxID=1169474 RepID=A0A0G4HPC3_9ALVE|eukprot:Cvel_7822.t1-p1 / transcript=Cvel_7822.t1 / gene=Cvel_7822 / organism=Chromera_velia_CCMP2878 / gene_product=Thymidylate synthase, putative / transcript_product=Thymidylate synthase, putative / location=Cvel_scaffold417:81456-83015(-) / protein_length=520 / sequence_SO=supercontig / SO=protein_coding / is_pseudo=false
MYSTPTRKRHHEDHAGEPPPTVPRLFPSTEDDFPMLPSDGDGYDDLPLTQEASDPPFPLSISPSYIPPVIEIVENSKDQSAAVPRRSFLVPDFGHCEPFVKFGRTGDCHYKWEVESGVSRRAMTISREAEGLVLTCKGSGVRFQEGQNLVPLTPSQTRSLFSRASFTVGTRHFTIFFASAVPADDVLAASESHETPDRPGTESFDRKISKLYRFLKACGERKDNKKGPNKALRGLYSLVADLSGDGGGNGQGGNVLPVTSLRKIIPYAAVVEALWYLRGEKNIAFLQRHKNRFWDAQAVDGIVGFNYGLLVNWPEKDAEGRIIHTKFNQLEKNVIQPLCDGKSSRQMVCVLQKPTEETVQPACTTAVQFQVVGDRKLDLIVTQRSSDTVLGLPHDAIVWAVILHLVRWEVKRRSQRDLAASSLCFSLHDAHYYEANEDALLQLAEREPIRGELQVVTFSLSSSVKDIFSLAESQFDEEGADGHWHADSLITFEGLGTLQSHEKMKVCQASSNCKPCNPHP